MYSLFKLCWSGEGRGYKGGGEGWWGGEQLKEEESEGEKRGGAEKGRNEGASSWEECLIENQNIGRKEIIWL